jgi:hypothetical protein
MDKASYHSVIKEGTKAPTSATRKGGMQKGLKDKKNPFDGKMKKTELYEIIKLKKPEQFQKCYFPVQHNPWHPHIPFQ